MSLDIFWFLPTSGDTRYLGKSNSGRTATNEYLQQIAVAADNLGYDGILIPTGSGCLDPWVAASSVAAVTRRLKLLVALRTALTKPTAAARMAATLDQATQGRLLLNVVAGGDASELAADGIFLDHDERYEEASEFLGIWRRLLAGEKVDFEGKHHRVKGAKLYFDAVQRPHPPLYFGGSSSSAHDLAAEHIDAYLSWGEPPAAVGEKIADVRARAARRGRKLRFGKYTLRKKNIDPASAACVTVSGNSMEPVLPDGSTVGVDTSARTIKDGDMYAWSPVQGNSATSGPSTSTNIVADRKVELHDVTDKQTCIEVKIVRSDKQMSQDPAIACAVTAITGVCC